MLDYITIGARLKSAREAQAISQEQVARRLNMTRQNVSLIERGQTADLETLTKYAALVNLPFVVDLGETPGDARVALLARLQAVVRDLDAPVFDMLLGMIERWEGQHDGTAGRAVNR